MSLSAQRVAQVALDDLKERGLLPTDIHYKDTGKSALQHTLEAISSAIIDEITKHGEVTVKLDQGLKAWIKMGIPVPTDGGAGLKTTLMSAAESGSYDTGSGTIK